MKYCTPKIHKPGNRLRRIVDYTGAIRYNKGQYIKIIGKPSIIGKTSHHMKNLKQNLNPNEMASIMIKPDDSLLSHDVVSLITSAPISETLDVIKKRLEDDTKLKLRTNLNVDEIMEQLKFIITTTYFSFRGTVYQQKLGTAMGSPLSLAIAHLFKEWPDQ